MLFEQLNADIVAAMKAKNAEDLTILRTLKSDIAKVSIDTKKDIDDGMVLDTITKTVKQYSDAVDIYAKANNETQLADVKHRIAVVSKYLPAQMDEDEVITLVNETKSKVGAETKKDMGKMMKELTPMLKGKFDSKKLSQIVSGVLA